MAFDPLSGIPTDPQAPPIIDDAEAALEVGRVIGHRYEVRARIGAGGMGRVYRVYDRDLREEIALKVVASGQVTEPHALQRLRDEVKAARKIAHKHVCRVFDYEEADGLHFLTMELIEGRNVRALLLDGSISRNQVVAIVRDVAAGLSAVHEEGMAHLDVKPENVVLRQDGKAVLVDFGLARRDDSRQGIAGTPAYMSPEQLRGGKLDGRSDVFSLGVLAFELLIGRTPFHKEASATTIETILDDSPTDMTAGVWAPIGEASVRNVLRRAMAKSPEDRYPVALEFAHALAEALGPAPGQDVALALTPSPSASKSYGFGRIWRVRVAVMLVLLLGSAGVIAWKNSRVAPFPVRPVVWVVPFENVTGDPALDGVRRSATEAARTGLQRLSGIDVHVAANEAEARAALADGGAHWMLKGTVDAAGGALGAQFERSGTWHLPSEPIEVAWSQAPDSGKSLGQLRERVLDEARILYREHQRYRRAIVQTKSEVAQAKLIRYYEYHYVNIVRGANEEVADSAQRLLDEAIADDPQYIPAYVERAYLRARGGTPAQIALATQDVDRAIVMDPSDIEARVMRCRVLQVASSMRESPMNAEITAAVDACSSAITAAPDSADVHIAFARLHNLSCKDEDAMNSLEQARNEDRAQTGRALAHLVHLAFDGEHWDRAERASIELLEFEEEQRKARKSIFTRLGIPPEIEAPLLRALVLLHDGKTSEARVEFEKQLAWLGTSSPEPILEAVAMRGLLVRTSSSSEQTKAKYSRLLEEHEKTLRDTIARTPLTAIDVAWYYQWVDPTKAVEWIELAQASTANRDAFSCNASLRIASIYRAAGRFDEARRATEQCKPKDDYDWERQCLAWMNKRLSK